MTPEEWGRRQAELAPPWSDDTFRLALATLGYAQLPEPDHATLHGPQPPESDLSSLPGSSRSFPTTQ